jgi:hypothetical protein
MPCACCNRGCCCLDGAKDEVRTTQEECEGSGGTWTSGMRCDDPCMCCVYKFLCFEKVESFFGPVAADTPVGSRPTLSDPIPASQPTGTITISNESGYNAVAVKGCAGAALGHQSYAGPFPGCYTTNPCGPGVYESMCRQWYYRTRVVASCVDCNGSEYDPGETQTPVVTSEEMQFPDGNVTCCFEEGVEPETVASCDECVDARGTGYPYYDPPLCNDNGQGCPVSRVTALQCVPITTTYCSTADAASLTPPKFSDCVEQTGVLLCQDNEFP